MCVPKYIHTHALPHAGASTAPAIIAEEKKDANSQPEEQEVCGEISLSPRNISSCRHEVSNMPNHDLSKENNNRHANMAGKGHSGGLNPTRTTLAMKES